MEIKLNGYKTYVSAMALIFYAVGGFISGKVGLNYAIPEIFIALGIMGLRHRVEVLKKFFEELMPKE